MAFPLPQTLSRAQMPSLVLYIFLFNYFYFLLYLKKMLIYIFVGKSNMGFQWCCSLNLLHKPMLLPCNHIFCKLVSSSSSSSNLWCFNFFIFHILSLIWFVFWVWVFFLGSSCIPISAQVGSDCSVCKAPYFNKGIYNKCWVPFIFLQIK